MLPMLPMSVPMWLWGLGLGIIAALFGMFVVAPLKGQPVASGWQMISLVRSDTGGEFDVRRMFQSEPPRIDLDGTVQASRGTAPTGHGWQGGEFATSI